MVFVQPVLAKGKMSRAAMPFGELDSAFRRLLAESLKPLEEQIRSLQQQLGDQQRASGTEFFTVKEAAYFASVAPGTIRRWIRDGKIASFMAVRPDRRCGGRSMIRTPSKC